MAEIEAISRNDQWSLAKPCNRGIHTARAKGVNLRDQQQTHEQSGESRSEEGHGGEGSWCKLLKEKERKEKGKRAEMVCVSQLWRSWRRS